ncbi:MAG: restriction endonuclease [Saprospiraceae bacterium]
MTKKSNAFQKAIHFIHDELKETDMHVTESAILEESDVDLLIPREIDVLIEKVENGETRKIAIECRDRSKKDDIMWIDGLIGKYLHLDVDRVIAVSSSGFSKAAKVKAKKVNIELRSIKEIDKQNRKQQFANIGMVDWQLEYSVLSILGQSKMGTSIELFADDKIIFESEEGTFLELFQALKPEFLKRFNKKFKEILNTTFRKKDDLSKNILIDYIMPIPEIQLVRNETQIISTLKISLLGTSDSKGLSTKYYFYENSMITKTGLPVNENLDLVFVTAQPHSSKKLMISADKKRVTRKK